MSFGWILIGPFSQNWGDLSWPKNLWIHWKLEKLLPLTNQSFDRWNYMPNWAPFWNSWRTFRRDCGGRMFRANQNGPDDFWMDFPFDFWDSSIKRLGFWIGEVFLPKKQGKWQTSAWWNMMMSRSSEVNIQMRHLLTQLRSELWGESRFFCTSDSSKMRCIRFRRLLELFLVPNFGW